MQQNYKIKCVKFAVREEYFKFINQFIDDSMFITCYPEIQKIKIKLKKYILDNQARDLKLEKDNKRLSQTRKRRNEKTRCRKRDRKYKKKIKQALIVVTLNIIVVNLSS